MQEKTLIIALGAVVVIIVVLFMSIIIFSLKKKKKKVELMKNSKKSIIEKITIKDMTEIAANKSASKNDLTNAILQVSRKFKFPPKIKGVAPDDIKIYLDFVLLVASHDRADAKLIAFMDTTLKKVNSEYFKEIDLYESEGLKQRGQRA